MPQLARGGASVLLLTSYGDFLVFFVQKSLVIKNSWFLWVVCCTLFLLLWFDLVCVWLVCLPICLFVFLMILILQSWWLFVSTSLRSLDEQVGFGSSGSMLTQQVFITLVNFISSCHSCWLSFCGRSWLSKPLEKPNIQKPFKTD